MCECDNLPWEKYIIYCLQFTHKSVFSYEENGDSEQVKKLIEVETLGDKGEEEGNVLSS